jgi:hypothetical protein
MLVMLRKLKLIWYYMGIWIYTSILLSVFLFKLSSNVCGEIGWLCNI